MKHLLLLTGLTAAFAVSCATAPPSVEQQASLAQARLLLRQNDPDAALTITDTLLQSKPDWREARLVAAEGSLQLAKQDPNSSRHEMLLTDASRDFERALATDGKDGSTWLQLAATRYQLSLFAESRDAAEAAIEAFKAAGNKVTTAQADAAVIASARAELRLLIVARQAEFAAGKTDEHGVVMPSKAVAKQAAMIRQRLSEVERRVPGDACMLSAEVCQWLGADRDALETLERGIRLAPGESSLHLAYQELYRRRHELRALAGAYTRMVREAPGVPILQWFHGRAQVMVADDARNQGNFQLAVDTYKKAMESFGQFRAMVPANAEAAAEWLAICELSIARSLVDSGDLAGAQQHLFAADAASPKAVAYDGDTPALVDTFGSHYTGVVFAINRALAESGTDAAALRKTLAFNEAVIQRHPGRWGFVYNNAALPARDLGVAVSQVADDATQEQKDAAQKAAMELWERSYRYYEEAVKLSPDDARIVNDCGLMLIYHLDRDFDRARALFEQAIAVGQPQIDALGADADVDSRNLLEEAVGDAWQNIAVLMARHLHRPFADYKEFCEKAVRYYPYQRRAAAHMLQNEGKEPDENAPRSRRRGGPADPGLHRRAQGAADKQGSAEKAAAFDKARKACEPKVKDGDFDAALSVLDDVEKQLRDYAPFQCLKGQYTLAYANQQRDGGRKGVELLYADAVNALKRSFELDGQPVATRLLLAEAQFESGDFEAAQRTATELLPHMQSIGGGKPEDLDRAHQLRAESAARSFIMQKQAGRNAAETLAQARTSFRHLEGQKRLDGGLLKTWASAEQWAGATAEAVNIYARAAKATPDDQSLLQSLLDTAIASNQLEVAAAALQGRTDALGQWYLGRCRYAAALELQTGGNGAEAQPLLDQAIACFAKSKAGNPAFADSCTQWIAMCNGKKGNLAIADKDFANAEKWLLEAARLRPDHIGDDLGNAETTKLGLLRVADKYFRGRDLGHAEAIYRAAAEAANADLDLLNNAGLFARDFGNQLEAAGKKSEAMALYEQSYKAYSRAQLLDSKNVRLRNDRALILIYHLEREWDTAQELLESAIADGDKALRDHPPETPQERNDAEEAVGDCYENLALLLLKHKRDGAAAKAAAEKSRDYHPGKGRPGAARHIAAADKLLQGK
jgi:hypothetical protein